MARIPAYSPAPPGLPGPLAVGEPLQAVSADDMAEGASGYLGFLALGVVTRQHLVGDMQYDGIASDYDDAWGELDDYPDVQAPNPIRLRRTPAGKRLWLGIWALAHPGLVKLPGGDLPPKLSVSLYDADGVLVDGPIEWSSTNGRLPQQPQRIDDARQRAWSFGTRDAFVFDPGDINAGWLNVWREDGGTPETWMTTGWSAEPSASDPRLLAYPDDDYRDFDLVFTTVGVRVYSVSVLEAYTPDGGA